MKTMLHGWRKRVRVHEPLAGSARCAVLACLTAFAVLVAATAADARRTPEPRGGTAQAEFGCASIIQHYTGFNDLPGNTVTESVKIDRVKGVVKHTFIFDGPEGSDVIPINLPPGHHKVDLWSKWRTNGLRGSRDQAIQRGIDCPPEPAMSIEKLQRRGSGDYTTEMLGPVAVGEVIDYEIIVTNTGNVPITLSEFSDPRCEPGTITGGNGEAPIMPARPAITAGQTIFFCTHTITPADVLAGSYVNVASATAVSEECSEPPCAALASESNTVTVTMNAPPTHQPAPVTPTPGTPAPSSGPAPSNEPGPRHSGVLAFSAGEPTLRGPRSCVHRGFSARLSSAGVRRVVFSLDGRRLATLTARDSRAGILTVHVARLRAGTHRLAARITVSSGASAPRTITRRLTVAHCARVVSVPRFAG
jgi:hypothetical protein